MSPSVVSYTLNGGPRPVAAATAARVRAAVAELGYVPNATARALVTGLNDLIGLVVHDITNPFYNRLAAAVQRAAEEEGLRVVVGSTLEDRSKSLPHIRYFDATGFRGIIVATYLTPAESAIVAGFETSVVQLDSTAPIEGAVQLRPMFLDASLSIMKRFERLGHTSIAFVGDRSPTDVRIRVWEEWHQSQGLPLGPFAQVPYSREGGYRGMAQILASHTPTALFAGSGLIASGALKAIREAGLRVPSDISIFSFDDIPELEFACPPVTAVHAPVEEMARDAVRSLTRASPLAPGLHEYPTRIIDRGSTVRLQQEHES